MTVATVRLTRRIKKYHANAVHFRRLARKRHRRAALWARRALALKRKGFNGRAAIALRNAMRIKGLAARAMLHATFYRRRGVAVRKVRMRRLRLRRARMRRGVGMTRAARILRVKRM